MAKRTTTDEGSPSSSKSEEGTGVPSKINDGTIGPDQRLTDDYTNDDNSIAKEVGTHPNRNAGKRKGNNNGYRGL